MPLSVIIKGFLKQFSRTRAISFNAEEPSEYMIESLRKSEEDVKAGRVSPTFTNAKDAIAWLDDPNASYANGDKVRDEIQRTISDKKIKTAFEQTLEMFLEDPNHPSLRNHQLKEKLVGYRSIDISGDWRAVFKEKRTEKQRIITFHMIGTHEDLYGGK